MSYPKTRNLILSAFALFSSTLAFSAPSCVAAKTCIPVNLENKSGTDLYAIINTSATNKYYDFISSTYTPNFNSSRTVFRVGQGTQTLYLPVDGITGGARMYLSTHELSGVPDLATYPYIHDKVEMGWSSKGTAGWNTTSVDFFGMPIQLQQGNLKVGFKDDAIRDDIINELTHNMGLESQLYDSRFFFKTGTDTVRVFSPQHFYTNLPNLWEPAITKGLDDLVTDDPQKGTGVYFKFNYGGNVYTNLRKLSDDSIQVDQNGVTKTITAINTGNAAAGQIQPIGDQFAGLLAAVINRGVLGNPAHWGQNGMPNQGYPQFYYQGNPGQYLYNTYAKVLIDHAINQRTYATAYDDYWHMDSSLQVGPNNNAPVTIRILPFHHTTQPVSGSK